MKKKLAVFALLMTVLGGNFIGASEAQAAHKTVEYGASWNYGSEIVLTGRRGYSNLFSGVREHSSAVSIGGTTVSSGWKKAGVEARASRIAGYTARPHYYYNIR